MRWYAVCRIDPLTGQQTFLRLVKAICAEQAENEMRQQRRGGFYEAHRVTDVAPQFTELTTESER